MLPTQATLGIAKLHATDVYKAGIAKADARLLFIPFSLPELNPYVYGGFGVTKDIKNSGTVFLP